MEEVVAGLDIGTTSIKLVLYSKKGVISSKRIDHFKRSSNQREIDPLKLLKDIFWLIRRCGNVKIRAIGISSFFPSLIAIDKDGNPLTKIITWLDNRGQELVINFKRCRKEAKKLQKKTGCIVHESHTLWKILWLKKNKKKIFLKAKKFLSLPEYLVYKLAGKFSVSYALASTTGLFNIDSLKWDKEILDMVAISESHLSECHSIFHTEKIRKKIRLQLGLDEDTLVVIGAGDGHLSNIGSGCLTDKKICSTIGTSSALRIVSSLNISNRSAWTYYLYDKMYLTGIATNAGSSTLSWFYRNIFQREPDNLFSEIDRMDLDGSTEVIFLPFLDGERGPNYSQKMLASMFGLKSNNTNVQMYTVVMEGILFNLYHCYTLLLDSATFTEMVATGGYIYSEKLLLMQADIFNIKIKVPYIEACAVGAAIVALVAIGEISTPSEIKTKYKVYIPNPQKHKQYMTKYRKYLKFYKINSKMLKTA